MKLKHLITKFQSLQALGAVKMPAKVGFRVGEAINIIKPKIEAYETQRNEKLKEYGVTEDGGATYKFLGDSPRLFTEEMQAMIDEDVDITVTTITFSDLGEIEIEPAHLAELAGFFIVESK